jgi:hypothetical protein
LHHKENSKYFLPLNAIQEEPVHNTTDSKVHVGFARSQFSTGNRRYKFLFDITFLTEKNIWALLHSGAFFTELICTDTSLLVVIPLMNHAKREKLGTRHSWW